ncbi:MAG TPA: hypothetical protein VHP32_06735 [Ignavibacteria bacterium]|nr:hypothetical protein [Ignavibacteria bacterium]
MYSPKINEDLIPIIKRRSLEIKKPMTKVVDNILRSALIAENTKESVNTVNKIN